MSKIDFSKPLFLEVPGTDRIRFTPHGVEQLRSRFAAAGVDIHRVRTKREALAAIRASSHVLLEELAELAEEDPALKDALSPLGCG